MAECSHLWFTDIDTHHFQVMFFGLWKNDSPYILRRFSKIRLWVQVCFWLLIFLFAFLVLKLLDIRLSQTCFSVFLLQKYLVNISIHWILSDVHLLVNPIKCYMMFFSSGFAAQLKVFACLNEIKKKKRRWVCWFRQQNGNQIY